jgi:SWI/SNF-related matrix-associated actin-dependent regulator 1 of chromatin subfamily A
MTALFPYQAAAVETILNASKVVYLAHEAGLGKSAVALTVARRRGDRRVLIACPLSVAYVWVREIRRWWPDAPPVTVLRSTKDTGALHSDGIFILTYGLISRSKSLIAAIKAAQRMDFTILDEAHALKNAKSNRTKALLAELRPNLGRALPMSGTPTPNHAGELYAILRSLRPDLITAADGKPMREMTFVERFCETRTMRINNRQITTITGSRNVAELRDRTAGFFLRETKANVLEDLPPLRFDVLPIEVEDPDRFKSFGQLLAAGGWSDEESFRIAAEMANATLYAELGLAKAPMVAEYVTDMLEGGTRQVVVWAVHHAVIDLLAECLRPFGVSQLDGRITAGLRDRAIDRFLRGYTRVFIGQIQAGGTGLTLIGDVLPCRDAIFAETSFSPSDNWQAACRIHRIGQHDAVLARFASAEGTYDDRIQEILARKAEDFAELFDNKEAAYGDQA